MKIKQVNAICTITFTALAVVSCGGSDKGPILTGVFVDSPVSGLSYVTPTRSGVTTAEGEYEYRDGEAVVFSIGSLALPVVVGAAKVTPMDMAVSDDITDPAVTNVARLLQSLDEDRDPANGIEISESTAAAFDEAKVFDVEDEGAVAEAVELAFDGARDAVSAEVAQAHFVESLSISSNSVGNLGQWQYLVPVGGTYQGDTLFLDNGAFALTSDGVVENGNTFVHNGVYQLLGENEIWFVSVTGENDDKLACFAKSPIAVADCGEGVFEVFEDEELALAHNNEGFDAEAHYGEASLDIGAATDSANEAVEEVIDPDATLEELFPACEPGSEDADGDGFGWQNDQSCLITVIGSSVDLNANPIVPAEPAAETVTSQPTAEVAPEPVVAPPEVIAPVAEEPAPTPEPVVESPVIETPVVEPPVVVEPEPVVEAPVIVEPEPVVISPLVEEPAAAIMASDITDLIVLTGQTNAAGLETSYNAEADATHERVFAFVENTGWQPADLHQSWDEYLPGNFSETDATRDPYNNMAYHMAKSLAEDPDRVVGIIMVTAPGEGISHWDYNSVFYTKIRDKVTAALSTLPQKDAVDAMIWSHGETDFLLEGTADTGATGFSSTDSDFYTNYYPNKLMQLISNLRSEWWYGGEASFICTETKKALLNPHLMALNTDDDNRTGCAAASDLATKVEDPFGNRFSADSLRTIGSRLAEVYRSIAN